LEERPSPRNDWRFVQFLRTVHVPGRLLDIGCGDGGFLAFARDSGWKGVGVDYESRMIAFAQEKGLEAYALDYAQFLKKRAAKEFDAVTLFDVLEHVSEPRELLRQIKPVLKRGGLLAITFPNDSRPLWFGREQYDYPPHHFTRWTRSSLKSFLEHEGFSIERLVTVGPSLRWLSEMIFDAWVAPFGLGLAKRLLFGEREGTISALYIQEASAPSPGVKSLLSDAMTRRRLSNYFKIVARVVTYPIALGAKLICLGRKDSGEHLFALARFEG
jgi:SAM-dependent methyltransferase